MAFASAMRDKTVFGDKRVVYGDYTNAGGTTGGDITTGLSLVEVFMIQPVGASVNTNVPVVNETVPLANDGGVVTIVTDANTNGMWMAIGL